MRYLLLIALIATNTQASDLASLSDEFDDRDAIADFILRHLGFRNA